MQRPLQSVFGVAAIVGFRLAHQRAAPHWCRGGRVGIGIVITFVLAVLFLKVPPITRAFGSANHVIDAIADATRARRTPRSSSATSAAGRCRSS